MSEPYEVPEDVKRYFRENSWAWEKEGLCDYRTWRVLSDHMRGLSEEAAADVFGTSIGYLSNAQNEIEIYREALRRLQRGEGDVDVQDWLDGLGFKVHRSKLGASLVKRISNLYQHTISVIHNFIRSVSGVLNMKMSEVSFSFAVSPTIDVKFTQ